MWVRDIEIELTAITIWLIPKRVVNRSDNKTRLVPGEKTTASGFGSAVAVPFGGLPGNVQII